MPLTLVVPSFSVKRYALFRTCFQAVIHQFISFARLVGKHGSAPDPAHVEEGEVSSFISVVKDLSDSLQSGRFSYSHRMKAGVNRDSHGLKVAQLAGMPPSALKVAKEVLSFMKAPRGKNSQGGMNVMLADLGRRFASPDPAARR